MSGLTIHCCNQMRKALVLEDLPFEYNPKFREYGISFSDGGSSVMQIQVCPWCGKELPSSLRDRWFAELEELSIDPYSNSIPPEFTTSEWWEIQT